MSDPESGNPSVGRFVIHLEGRTGDPAQNEKVRSYARHLARLLKGQRSPSDPGLSGGTIFPGYSNNELSGYVVSTFENENGVTPDGFSLDVDSLLTDDSTPDISQ